jgi:hypothetical protein
MVLRKVSTSSLVVLPICSGDGWHTISINAHICSTMQQSNNDLDTPVEAGGEVKGAREEGKELEHPHPRRRDVKFVGQKTGYCCKNDSDRDMGVGLFRNAVQQISNQSKRAELQ